jgi:chromate transporter
MEQGADIVAKPSLGLLFRESLKVGCLGFGGPAGQIALMHRIFVEERGWIDEARFQRMLAFCMLLPGPEAQQLATYVGWRLRGAAGALIAGWLFVIPGALIVLGLSWFYVLHGEAPLVAAAFDGIKAAVVALVVEALLKVGKRSLKSRGAVLIAVAAFLALMLGAPFPFVILAAGLIGAITPPPLAGEVLAQRGEGEAHPALDSSPVTGGAVQAALWLVLWLLPPALVALTLGVDHVLFQIALLFSMLACVTFGGAYALLAYLTTQAVAQGWLTTAQMIDGLGLAETTPGPLVLVNEFVGFLAGWNEGGFWLAVAGAAMAAWCTFAPSFVWIFAGAPVAEKLQNAPRAQAALMFAAHALFRDQLHWGAATLPDITTPNLWMCALALAAGIALIRFKAPLLLTLAACAVAGLAAQTLGWR